MAYTDRAIIACSVSALAITLVTIYFWRSKKKYGQNLESSLIEKQTNRTKSSEDIDKEIFQSISSVNYSTDSYIERNCSTTTNKDLPNSDIVNNFTLSNSDGMHMKNISFNINNKSNVTCSKTTNNKEKEDKQLSQTAEAESTVELESNNKIESSRLIVAEQHEEMILIKKKHLSQVVEANIDSRKSQEQDLKEIDNNHSGSDIEVSNVDRSNIKMNKNNDNDLLSAHKTECNQSSNQSPTSTKSSSIVVTMSEEKKLKEKTGHCRQTFAQILSNNCDSSIGLKSNSKKTMQPQMKQEPTNNNCSNNIDKYGDNSSNLEDGSKNTSSTKDENEVDIYHNYPDLTNTPTSEEQVVDCGSDDHSQGSNDSGQGSCFDTAQIDSTTSSSNFFKSPSILDNAPDNQTVQYNFEIPMHLCGLLIGRKGTSINLLKRNTKTYIVIQPYNECTNICSIFGFKSNIINALNLIRNRFPIENFPEITYNHIELTPTIPLNQSCQLHLPMGIMTEVILSYTINPGHFFLQQPTHPTYPKLSSLDQAMKENYSQTNAPMIPQVYPGLVCAAPNDDGWYRALVKYVHESNRECDLIFVDYGEYAFNVPVVTLRQIHCNFMSLPFQASECYMAQLAPANIDLGWTPQANAYFQQLAHGQLIYATIESYNENGIPYVNLYKPSETNNLINISEQLVNKGHAQWIGSQ